MRCSQCASLWVNGRSTLLLIVPAADEIERLARGANALPRYDLQSRSTLPLVHHAAEAWIHEYRSRPQPGTSQLWAVRTDNDALAMPYSFYLKEKISDASVEILRSNFPDELICAQAI